MRLHAGDTHRRDNPGEPVQPGGTGGKAQRRQPAPGVRWRQLAKPGYIAPGKDGSDDLFTVGINLFARRRRFVGLDLTSPKRKSGTTFNTPFGAAPWGGHHALSFASPRSESVTWEQPLPGIPLPNPDNYAWSVRRVRTSLFFFRRDRNLFKAIKLVGLRVYNRPGLG